MHSSRRQFLRMSGETVAAEAMTDRAHALMLLQPAVEEAVPAARAMHDFVTQGHAAVSYYALNKISPWWRW